MWSCYSYQGFKTCTQRTQTSLAHADHYSQIITCTLQCGQATAIKVFKQELKERRPHWPMENIIPILPQKLWIVTCTTISGKRIECNTCKDFSNDFASRSFVTENVVKFCNLSKCFLGDFIHMLISVIKSIKLAW